MCIYMRRVQDNWAEIIQCLHSDRCIMCMRGLVWYWNGVYKVPECRQERVPCLQSVVSIGCMCGWVWWRLGQKNSSLMWNIHPLILVVASYILPYITALYVSHIMVRLCGNVKEACTKSAPSYYAMISKSVSLLQDQRPLSVILVEDKKHSLKCHTSYSVH